MRDVIRPPPASNRGRPQTDRKSAVQQWRGVDMVRSHSFLQPIEQICKWAVQIDVTRVGIVGDMGSGKSTLAEAVGHAIHTRMAKEPWKLPFAMRICYKEHLKDFDTFMRNLEPQNYVLVFDDVSFLEADTSRADMGKLKQAVTTIRHMHGRDVKIVVIYNYHYSLGLDKFLRQVEFQFWTSAGQSEGSNMERMFGSRKAMKIVNAFRKQRATAIDTGHWYGMYGKDGRLEYKWRNPWIPVLFWEPNMRRLRQIVTPTRQWMQPACPTCAVADMRKHGPDGGDVKPADFVARARKAFGSKHFDTALKLIALENGMGTYSRGTMSAKRSLDAALHAKAVSLESLLVECGMTINKARVKPALSEFLKSIGVKQDLPPGSKAAAAGDGAEPAAPPKPRADHKTRAPPRIV